ncbi:MAG: zinc ABC transporter substrate-binding protein [Burkholderiales bacterium]|nr:zinc ABC transporter substrate-binding protein [Burkholderiales bacterium]
MRVVASFSILADLAREVGGARADVHALVGADADAHVYSPRPADLLRLRGADLVVLNGLGFDGWMPRLLQSAGYRGRVLVASDGIVARRQGRGQDPHAWHDPVRVRRYVGNLRDALAALRPAEAPVFAERAEDFERRLAAIDAQARRALGALPRERRRVLSSHDAFGYLGEAYGIDFLAPARGALAESSAHDVAALIRLVRRERVQALFVENIADRRLLERIATETGARIGGTLYSDALSAPGGPADSYLKLMAHNLRTLAQALAS